MKFFEIGETRVIEDSTCGGQIIQTIVKRETKGKNHIIEITIEERWISVDSSKLCKHKTKHRVYNDYKNHCEVYGEWDYWNCQFVSRKAFEFTKE